MPAYVPAAVQELREELMARPSGQWVMRMYAEHRGVSTETRQPVHA